MVNRTAVVLDAIPGFAGTIDIDVTLKEIDVANIASLFYWPYIDNDYGRIPSSSPQALYDRMTDAPLIPATATTFTIGALPGPIQSISISSTANRWLAPLAATDKGFAIAAIVDDTMAFSSNGPSNSWWVSDDGAGKLTMKLGATTTVSGDYTGPTLLSTKSTVVLFNYDKVAGKITLRVDGTYVQEVQNEALKTAAIHPSMQIGVKNDNGTQTGRFGQYGGVVAFNKTLTASEITKVEALLLSYIP